MSTSNAQLKLRRDRRNRTADLHDSKTDTKVVLSGLWVTLLLVFADVDIFGFWRADVINGAMAGEVPGIGFQINQSFLVFITIYILIPSLMVIVSLLRPLEPTEKQTSSSALPTWRRCSFRSPAKPGSTSSSAVSSRAMLLVAIARVAWTWPRPGRD